MGGDGRPVQPSERRPSADRRGLIIVATLATAYMASHFFRASNVTIGLDLMRNLAIGPEALGALTGNQAVQQIEAGLKAVYVSGWQVAADANLAVDVVDPIDEPGSTVKRIGKYGNRAGYILIPNAVARNMRLISRKRLGQVKQICPSKDRVLRERIGNRR